MNSYYIAKVWDKADIHIRTTLTNTAVILDEEIVYNLPVIEVTNASYRNVQITHGFFAISPFEIPADFNLAKRIVVLCRWFDRRLRATGLRLRVDGSIIYHPSYSGTVITNIHD